MKLEEQKVPDDERSDPLWKVLVKSLPLIFIVSALTVFLYKFGWFQWIENATLDLIARSKTLRNENVFLVDITDDDYRKLFFSQSPLDITRLSEIVNATADGDPEVIVVDLDTGGIPITKPTGWKGTLIQAVPCEIVSAEKTASLMNVPEEGLALLPTCSRTVLIPRIENIKAGLGLAFMPRDIDGFVRRYCRQLKTVPDSNSRTISLADSLPWAIAKAYNNSLAGKDETESNEVFLTFARNQSVIPRISASDVLSSHGTRGWKLIVGGKIVIIGGTFQEGRDVYKTLAGETSGMSIVAQAVESELQFGGIKAINEIWLLMAQFVASILFVVINHRFRNTMIPLVGLIAIPFAAAGFSLISFQTMALWANFVPVLFVVQFHALFEHINDVRRKNRDLNKTNEILSNTRKELAKAIDTGGQQERRRIAAGLHDETLMYLFEVETVIDDLRQSDETMPIYEKAREVVQKTRKNVRDVMNNLYPSVLKDHGLSVAIKTLTESVSTAELAFKFDDTSKVDDTSRKVACNLGEAEQLRIYKIVQNAMRNTIEHAGAKQAHISLEAVDNRLILTISDDGKGFANLSGRDDSQGVRNMKDYADLLDGTIEWRTPAQKFGCGTEVVLNIPNVP